MIEVLISLFVFAVGALGLAALQITSKQAGAEAVQRTLAASVAFDLLERMRLNSSGSSYPLTNYVSGQGFRTLDAATNLGDVVDCAGTTCTPQDLAGHDLQESLSALLGASEQRGDRSVGGLVDPTLCISGPPDGSSGTYTATVAWRGQATLVNANAGNACGSDSGKYDDVEGDNKYRRILSLSSYITHE